MTNLKDALSEAEVPGVGEVDATDPVEHVSIVVGVVALLGAVGIGTFLYNQVKSQVGAEDITNPLNQTLGEF